MDSNHDPKGPAGAASSRDAVRSRAWRSRHGQHLQALLSAAGVGSKEGASHQSYMAQLKKTFAAVWARALADAPASMIRHDPSLTRAERRRISSVKNNRLCRHRHQVFLAGVERELEGRGQLPRGLQRTRVTASPSALEPTPAPAAPPPRPLVANAPSPMARPAGHLLPLSSRPTSPRLGEAGPRGPSPFGQRPQVAMPRPASEGRIEPLVRRPGALSAAPPRPQPQPQHHDAQRATPSPMPRPAGHAADPDGPLTPRRDR